MALVLVTGASSGVGAATARALCARGDHVILLARSKDLLAQIAANIGDLASAVPCDAGDPEQVARMVATVKAEHGIPDVIVHCAGAGAWKTVQDTDPSEAMTMMQAPYFSAFNVTHGFLSDMMARGSGTIINVNSPACVVPWPSSVGYAAARAALKGFHDALSQDLAGTGVKTCHVIFGKIDSEYFANNPGVEDAMPALTKTIPTLTSERTAAHVLAVIDKPRHMAIFPWILRVHCAFGAWFPSIARWLLRF